MVPLTFLNTKPSSTFCGVPLFHHLTPKLTFVSFALVSNDILKPIFDGSTTLIYSPFAVVFVTCNGASGDCVPNPTFPAVSTVIALILFAVIENGCDDVVPISGVALVVVFTLLTLRTTILPDTSKLSVGLD